MGSPTVLPSACATGQQHQQAYHLLRAMRRLAIVPDVFTYNAAISLCDGAAASAAQQIVASVGHAFDPGVIAEHWLSRSLSGAVDTRLGIWWAPV